MEFKSLQLYGHPFADFATITHDIVLPHAMQNDACLAYIQSGTQKIYSATQQIIANDGEAILMKCGNYIANVNGADPENPFQSIVFHMDPEAIKKAFGGVHPPFLNQKMGKKPVDPALKLQQNDLLDSFVTSLMPYFETPELATDDMLAVKLQELVVILSKTDDSIATRILGTLYTPEQIRLDQIVTANLYNNLSIPELAHLCLQSESTFKREFKKVYNESPAKYIRRKKLEKAAELLSRTEMPISDICWDVGFENPAHFSTLFTKAYSKSPRAYRSDLN